MLLFLAASPFTVCHLYRLSRRRANAPAEIGGFFRRPGRVCVPSALRAGAKRRGPFPVFPLSAARLPRSVGRYNRSSHRYNRSFFGFPRSRKMCNALAQKAFARAQLALARAQVARARAHLRLHARKKPVNTGILPRAFWILRAENESCRQHAPPAGRRTVTTAPRGTGRRRAIARDGTERNLAQSRKGAKPQTRPAIPKSPSFARPCCAGAPRLCVRYIPFLHPSSFISHL